MDLSSFVKSRREELGLSLRELAKRCDLSHAYIGYIEAGKNPRTGEPMAVTIGGLEKMAKGLRVDVDDLIRIARGEEPKSAEPAPRPMMNDEEAQAFLDTFETLSPEARKVAMEHLLFLKHRDSQAKE